MSSIAEGLYVEGRGKFKHDAWLLLSTLLLLLTGFLSLYSIDSDWGTNYLNRQILYAGLGIAVYFIFNKIKLEFWRKSATALYLLNIFMLLAVLGFGRARGVAQRWIELGPIQFQPSELTKIILAITLAAYFANRKDEIWKFKTFVGAALHVVPIALLVFMQPHLGGALALLTMGLLGAAYAGVPGKFFPIAIGAFLAVSAFIWFTPKLLPPYIRDRAVTKYQEIFLGDVDRKGDSYQQIQSILAISGGGVVGEGYLKGELKSIAAVPEQHNDFVFSVIGEEGGLAGSMIVLGLFGFFFYRVWLVGFRARSDMGRIVAGCLLTVLAFHTIINLSMVLMIGPVIGMWLPFVSYGGTALWMCLAAVGLLDQIE